MLRELQVNGAKNIPADRTAATAMVTGMGVVLDAAMGRATFPAAEAGEDIFFVEKERVPTGINTGRVNMSDYDADFVNVAEDEYLKMIPTLPHERYATDQYDPAGLAVGDAIAVDVDGRWKRATVPSLFRYMGPYNDAGHDLIVIEKYEAAKTN